jgi:SAM-dependent methyltransferase
MAQPETNAYYEAHAATFVEGTVGASMAEVLDAFASMLPSGGQVLDWGCGSGRDSKALRKMGFAVTSTDASATMCAEALRATGTVVRHESFDQLREVGIYDGVWACASILHVQPNELPGTLACAANALRDGGVLYCSFKYGCFAGIRNGRWFTDLGKSELTALLEPRFRVSRMWVSGDVRPGRGGERWLNCLATKR